MAIFWELSTDRQIGMSAGPIPHRSIIGAIQFYGITEVETFIGCIRAMDKVFMDYSLSRTTPDGDTISRDPMTPEKFSRMFKR